MIVYGCIAPFSSIISKIDHFFLDLVVVDWFTEILVGVSVLCMIFF